MLVHRKRVSITFFTNDVLFGYSKCYEFNKGTIEMKYFFKKDKKNIGG